MNYQRAMLLVAALRSGKYQQTQGKLRLMQSDHDDHVVYGHCCLGVACDISGLGCWEGADYVVDNHDTRRSYSSDTYLPEPVRQWLGMQSEDGSFSPDGDDEHDVNSLVDMNDGNWTFAQIADFIEKNWERL